MTRLKLNKIKYFIFLILSLSIFTKCQKEVNNIPEFKLYKPDNIDSLEYQIYDALFSNFNFDTIVVLQQTLISRPMIIQNMKNSISKTKHYNNLDTTIFTDFSKKNDTSYNLDKSLLRIGNQTIILITKDEINYNFSGKNRHNAWNDFKLKYSTHFYYEFSRVGYNKDRNQAVFEFIASSENSDSIPTSVVHYFKFEDSKWENVYDVTMFFDY